MAFPKHTHWKKGQSGNPKGKPPLPAELKAFKELTRPEVQRLFAKYARMSLIEIEAIMSEGTTSAIEMVIASGLIRAIKDGDYSRLNMILDRTIGKVPNDIDIGLPQPVIIKRLTGEQVILSAEKAE